MACTPYVLFGWVGAILINVGFITLISWGTTIYWPLGFVACGFYTAILFALGRWLEGTPIQQYERVRNDPSRQEEIPFQDMAVGVERNNYPNDVQDSTISTATTLPLTVSILYGLSVVSMGVCGSFFPINLVPVCTDDPYSGHPRYSWMTNFSNLPEGPVQDWARSEQVSSYGSFAYVANTKVTWFSGSDAYYNFVSPSLWAANGTAPPQNHPDYRDPQGFTVLNNDSVCFMGRGSDSQTSMRVYCSNGTKICPIVSPKAPLYDQSSDVSELFGWNNTLWFKQIQPLQIASGALVFSVKVDSMEYSLHSVRVETKWDSGCGKINFKRSLLSMFTVAIPTTLLSLALWKAKSPPSMAITTFAGFSLIFTFAYIMVDPNVMGGEAPWQWWFCLFGAAWMLGSTYLNLTIQVVVAKPPLQWGLVVAALSFAYGAVSLLPMNNDDFLAWFLLNISVVFPILFCGMANSSMFLIFLGSIGFLADAARISQLVNNEFLSFMVFSVTGLVVGFIGFQLTKNQTVVESFAVGVVSKLDVAVFGQALGDSQSRTNDMEAISTPSVVETP
jgi:hypothetical protein